MKWIPNKLKMFIISRQALVYDLIRIESRNDSFFNDLRKFLQEGRSLNDHYFCSGTLRNLFFFKLKENLCRIQLEQWESCARLRRWLKGRFTEFFSWKSNFITWHGSKKFFHCDFWKEQVEIHRTKPFKYWKIDKGKSSILYMSIPIYNL